MRTFHRLHKDLLFLTGVLLVQQHAVKDAAKCACLKTHTHTHILFEGKGSRREPEALHSKIKMSQLADLWTEVDGLFCLMFLNGIRQFWLLFGWREPKRV